MSEQTYAKIRKIVAEELSVSEENVSLEAQRTRRRKGVSTRILRCRLASSQCSSAMCPFPRRTEAGAARGRRRSDLAYPLDNAGIMW